MDNIVVVGYGIAGATAAATLREQGYRGRLTIVGNELHEPYSRPALSKSALTEEGEFSSHLLPPADFNAEILRGISVTGLNLERRQLQLSNGNTQAFDGLVIASGIRPRKVRPDLDLELTFRNVNDALTLRTALQGRPRVVVIGGGVLGMELASACLNAGCLVTVVCRGQPMGSSLGTYLADVMVGAAKSRGVTIMTPHAVDVRTSTNAPDAREVVLANGSTVEADLVITAIGDVPNTEWLEHTGLLTESALHVDERGRLTPHIVAAGDVAAIPSRGGHRRVPLWTSAIEQAKVAARALLQGDTTPPLDFQQYFWTDQFGLALKACGPLPVSGAPAYLEGEPGRTPTVMRWQNADGSGTAVTINYRMPVPKLRALSRQAPQPVPD